MIGQFGGKEIMSEVYVKPKTNLYMEFQKIYSNQLTDVDLLVPLMNWYSNYTGNILKMQKLNRSFFYSDKNVLNHYMVLSVNKNFKFIKYPKKTKDDEDFIVGYIKRYYNWTDREYEFYKEFVKVDEELIAKLDQKYGFDNSECKKLGIKREKITKKFEAPVKRGWF